MLMGSVEKLEFTARQMLTEVNLTDMNDVLRKTRLLEREIKRILAHFEYLNYIPVPELERYVNIVVLEELRKAGLVSSNVFVCAKHISDLIVKALFWKRSYIDSYWVDLLIQWQTFEAANTNLFKYMFDYGRKRRELLRTEEYLWLAVNMYQKDYNERRAPLSYLMSIGLPRIDYKINLRTLINRIFPKDKIEDHLLPLFSN